MEGGQFASWNTIPIPGSAQYLEDFTTTTYLDSGPTTAVGWGTGQISVPRVYHEQIITKLDFYSTPLPTRSIEVQGRKAYIGWYNSSAEVHPISDSVQILNISDIRNLTPLSNLDAGTRVSVVRVSGDTLFVGTTFNGSQYYNHHANEGAGIILYNVSNPHQPKLIDVNGGPTNFTDVAIEGGLLVATGFSNPSILGTGYVLLSDVHNPALILGGGATLMWEVLGLDVSGSLIYLARGTQGLHIRQYWKSGSWHFYTDPVGTLDTPGNATDVLVDGHIAYVADGPSGVQIIDVSNPNSTMILGSYDTPGTARRLALHEKALYVADGTGGVQILDVTDPTDPILVGSIALPFTWEVALFGGDLLVATDAGVYSYRVGQVTPSLPIIGSYSGGYEVWDVCVDGDTAYIAAGPDGLFALNVSDPEFPVLLDHFIEPGGEYRRLDVAGRCVYVADYGIGNGLLSFNVSDPTQIEFLDLYPLNEATDVFITGGIACVCGGHVFDIINATDPTDLVSLSQTNIGNANAKACWVQGYSLYIVAESPATFNQVFLIYDIRSYNSPYQTFSLWDTGIYYADVFVDGDSAYLAAMSSAQHWNITHPYNPVQTDSVPLISALGVWGFGPLLLVAHANGITLFNATNPHNIQTLGTSIEATNGQKLVVHGDYVYVANQTDLVILRLFNSPIGVLQTGSYIASSIPFATSTTQFENITLSATVIIPVGTSIIWSIRSGTGGWEPVTLGVKHTLSNPANDLSWRAILTNSPFAIPVIFDITIIYEYNELPTRPNLYDPGEISQSSEITISWDESDDPSGSIQHYELQMSNFNNFSEILSTWLPTNNFYDVSGLTNGTYYFRVRAIDDDDEAGPWSYTVDIQIYLPELPPPPGIPGFPLAAILLGVGTAIGLGFIMRRRKE